MAAVKAHISRLSPENNRLYSVKNMNSSRIAGYAARLFYQIRLSDCKWKYQWIFEKNPQSVRPLLQTVSGFSSHSCCKTDLIYAIIHLSVSANSLRLFLVFSDLLQNCSCSWYPLYIQFVPVMISKSVFLYCGCQQNEYFPLKSNGKINNSWIFFKNVQTQKKGDHMEKMLNLGLCLRKSKHSFYRILGNILLLFPVGYGKWVEYSARNVDIPASWDEKDSELLKERIWQTVQNRQK